MVLQLIKKQDRLAEYEANRLSCGCRFQRTLAAYKSPKKTIKVKALTHALEKDILLGEVDQYKAHRQVLYSLFVLGNFLKVRSLARALSKLQNTGPLIHISFYKIISYCLSLVLQNI